MLPLLALLSCKQEDVPDCTPALSLDGDDFSLESACGSLALAPVVVGDGALTVSLTLDGDTLTPTVTAGSGGGTLRAVALTGTIDLFGTAPARIWRQGYQSWWWSGVADLSPMALTDDGLPQAGGDGDGTSAGDETPYSSWWLGLLGRLDGASVLLGVLGSARLKFTAAFTDDAAWAVWGGRGEAIALEPGASITLDPLWVGIGSDAFALHREYAEAAAVAHGVSPRTDRPPVGWATWTAFYEDITEEQVRENLAAAVALNARGDLAPVEVLQIDDGWANTWGDWTASERFPSGMAAIAADISAAGLTPGIWMAPFYAATDAPVFTDHPDWWVQDSAGDLLTFDNFGPTTHAVLDVTHPDAAGWLSAQIADRVDEGFDYLKLDFLYAGAQEGVRRADVTGMEAFHIGMRIITEAADGAFILACGSPMLPSLGYADAYRTGADIAFNVAPDPDPDFLRWQARATAARSWQSGLWWWVDPDQLLVRAPLSDAEVSGALVAGMVSGGTWMLGDDLTDLPDDRLHAALDAALVDTRGLVGAPVDPLAQASGLDAGPLAERGSPDDVVPTVWRLSDGGTALLNLSAHTVSVTGPGGVELLTGEAAAAGPRTLTPGAGEVWY